MKVHTLFAALAILIPLPLHTSETTPETTFIQKVQSALDAQDGNALFSLVHLEGVEPGMKEMLQKQISNIATQQAESISLIEPLPDQIFEYTRNGVVYKTNLAPIKLLKIDFSGTTSGASGSISNQSITLPVGRIDYTLFITTAVPTSE